MSSHSPEEIKKHVKIYITVFAALMVLTFVTVAVSYLHLSIFYTVLVALVIATVKGSLVASYFMHLISEKKMIYWALLLTVVFFIFLMFVPILTSSDPIIYRN
ncbi:MAG: cytochrome C oxidase subunit IV family protein [Ignavibacteriales bacterium]|nr:cytochrome C oxidase subunit IV family protein [Ignavibacteriales bacterium]